MPSRFFPPCHGEVNNDFGWWQMWNRSMPSVEREKDLIDSLCHLLGKECPAAHRTDGSRDILYNHLNRASCASEHPDNRVTMRLPWASLEAAF